MTTAELSKVRELIAEVRDNLNDKVDVSSELAGEGPTWQHTITPYQGVGHDIERLERALFLLGRGEQRPELVLVDAADTDTVFPVYATRGD
jgi:hypothetical protein